MIYDSRQTCINCFDDKIIRDFIESEGEIGVCDWCGSTEIKTTPIVTLSEMFRAIVDCYNEVSCTEGELISVCLQEDMGPGKNVLLFNPDDGDPFEVKYVRIGTPAYPITEIDERDDLYDDWPYQILVEDIN